MIFVDTGFFFALLSERDPDHARALEVFETLRGQNLKDLLLTTNHLAGATRDQLDEGGSQGVDRSTPAAKALLH